MRWKSIKCSLAESFWSQISLENFASCLSPLEQQKDNSLWKTQKSGSKQAGLTLAQCFANRSDHFKELRLCDYTPGKFSYSCFVLFTMFQAFKNDFFEDYFVGTSVLPVCMYVFHRYAWCPWSLWNWSFGGCEPPGGCLETTLCNINKGS